MRQARVSRRRFLAGGAAASAGVLLPATAAEADTPNKAAAAVKPTTRKIARKVDVVVVGAGLAGITAARNVSAQGKSVVLLEARSRVGGRTLNHTLPGTDAVVEVGGEFVGPTQDFTLELAQEMEVATFPAYQDLNSVFVNAQGQSSTFSGALPSAGAVGIVDLAVLVNKLDTLASNLTAAGLSDYWNWSDAETYDYETAYSWIQANTPDGSEAASLVDLFFDSAFGALSAEVSMLYVIAQIAGFGNAENVGTIERGIGSKGGAQDSRFVGGSQLLSIRAADALGRNSVILDAPVRSITQSGNQATVTSDAGVWKGRRVIVATPPQLAAQINYEPLMPPVLDAMRRRMTLGTLMKIHAVYPEPFWREDPGVWMGLKIGGCVPEMFDNTPPEGKPGVLMGFHGGRAWIQYANNPAGRRQAALNDFASVFGTGALNPIDYFEQDWTTEQWSRGCPVSVVGPGVATEFLPNLIAPFGLVHWAGTETAEYWNGYMSGAIQSGVRAAQEVVAEL